MSDFEWCHDCKEYDHEKHCCPRWTKVIRTTLNDNINAVLDEIRAEITDTLYVDSLIFGELIDFRNGKIDADDVIEEFNRVTRLEVLKILDKHKAESEVEECNVTDEVANILCRDCKHHSEDGCYACHYEPTTKEGE